VNEGSLAHLLGEPVWVVPAKKVRSDRHKHLGIQDVTLASFHNPQVTADGVSRTPLLLPGRAYGLHEPPRVLDDLAAVAPFE
jgi:hypothetical protein